MRMEMYSAAGISLDAATRQRGRRERKNPAAATAKAKSPTAIEASTAIELSRTNNDCKTASSIAMTLGCQLSFMTSEDIPDSGRLSSVNKKTPMREVWRESSARARGSRG